MVEWENGQVVNPPQAELLNDLTRLPTPVTVYCLYVGTRLPPAPACHSPGSSCVACTLFIGNGGQVPAPRSPGSYNAGTHGNGGQATRPIGAKPLTSIFITKETIGQAIMRL